MKFQSYFAVIFFDNDGNVRLVEESQKRKRHSEANLYVVPFARYQLMETMPLSMMKHLDEEVPPVFMILDTYDKDIKSLLPGTHLFCVYGDNWFQVQFLKWHDCLCLLECQINQAFFSPNFWRTL